MATMAKHIAATRCRYAMLHMCHGFVPEREVRRTGQSSRPCRPSVSTDRALKTASALLDKRCTPCEDAQEPLHFMGLCDTLAQSEIEPLLTQVPGWSLATGKDQHLRLRRTWKARNFMKALDLCMRLGKVSEAEGHHPDLHLTGWNSLTAEVWTHTRGGLTENDFILAAKMNAVDAEELMTASSENDRG